MMGSLRVAPPLGTSLMSGCCQYARTPTGKEARCGRGSPEVTATFRKRRGQG